MSNIPTLREQILKSCLCFFCFFLFILFSFPTLALAQQTQKADLWQKWTVSDENNKSFIVHDSWDFFIKRFVLANPDGSGINYIDFDHIKDDEIKEIDTYLDYLSSIPISTYARKEQLPYWINLHNALMVRTIALHYPGIKTAKDINFSTNPLKKINVWEEKLIEIEGEMLSLDDIMHRILRPIWKDPEILYSLYRGAFGSPNLQYDAFTSENSPFLLYRGASHYINHPRGVLVNEKDQKLILSSLYQWYQSDFSSEKEHKIIAHLQKYADEDLKEKLDKINSIDKYNYDWRLNSWIEN